MRGSYTLFVESPYQAPLTTEQLNAIGASGGFAQCEDPTTHVLYRLIQIDTRSVDDEYVRQKIEEAYADGSDNGIGPLDMSAIKAELHRRLATKSDSRR